MIIAYFGTGKGKTTAALGLALRASGYEKKILFAQFVKSPSSKTGEDVSLKKIKYLDHQKFGLGFIGIHCDPHTFEDHQKAAQSGLDYIEKNIEKNEIIILDEILFAIKSKLINEQKVLDLIAKYKKKKDFVLTGRPRIKGIFEKCDLITEMKNIRHPFDSGEKAARSIDY